MLIIYLFIWYIFIIFTQVKGQRLVYKFRNLPYKYEPGITRSVYRDRFQTINTSPCDQMPGMIKDLLPLIELNSSPPGSKAFFSSGLPPRGSSPWKASPRASSEGCTCLDVELSQRFQPSRFDRESPDLMSCLPLSRFLPNSPDLL